MSGADSGSETAGVDFLDFLFTFVLGFGLVSDRSILTEDWLQNGEWFSERAFRDLSVTLLGIFTLTLSWFGYHASIKRQKISYSRLSGLVRFQIDVVLILIYGIMILSYEQVKVVLLLFFSTFLIFVVWDWFKAREANRKWLRHDDRTDHRDLVTVLWTAAAFILVLLYQFLPWDILYAWVAIAIGFLYRVNKIKPFRWVESKLGVTE